MTKPKPDLIGCLGLVIIVVLVLAFILLTRDRPGFFQGFAPLF